MNRFHFLCALAFAVALPAHAVSKMPRASDVTPSAPAKQDVSPRSDPNKPKSIGDIDHSIIKCSASGCIDAPVEKRDPECRAACNRAGM